jgi:hypothetical protein
MKIRGDIIGDIIIEGEKGIILWLTDEGYPRWCEGWGEMKELLMELIRLSGSLEYTHVLQEPQEEYRRFASTVLRTLRSQGEPEGVVCLTDALKDFMSQIVPGASCFHFQPSRLRDITGMKPTTVEYVVKKGEKAENIREKLREYEKIWLVDTIAFRGGTLEKVRKDLEIGGKNLTFIVMGITPEARERFEKEGIEVIYNFEIKIKGEELRNLWHIDDLLVSTPTLRGTQISPSQLFEYCLSWFKGEISLEDILMTYEIPSQLPNHNLFLNCGKNRFIAQYLPPERLVENAEKIKEVLRRAEILNKPYESDVWVREVKRLLKNEERNYSESR